MQGHIRITKNKKVRGMRDRKERRGSRKSEVGKKQRKEGRAR